jgi:hypothetical protein
LIDDMMYEEVQTEEQHWRQERDNRRTAKAGRGYYSMRLLINAHGAASHMGASWGATSLQSTTFDMPRE